MSGSARPPRCDSVGASTRRCQPERLGDLVMARSGQLRAAVLRARCAEESSASCLDACTPGRAGPDAPVVERPPSAMDGSHPSMTAHRASVHTHARGRLAANLALDCGRLTLHPRRGIVRPPSAGSQLLSCWEIWGSPTEPIQAAVAPPWAAGGCMRCAALAPGYACPRGPVILSHPRSLGLRQCSTSVLAEAIGGKQDAYHLPRDNRAWPLCRPALYSHNHPARNLHSRTACTLSKTSFHFIANQC